MENFINDLAGFVWTWNVPILVGSGIFFLIYSKLTPFKYLKHAFELILGKHSKKDDVGEVKSGTECGVGIKNYKDIRPGDKVEVFDRKEEAQSI